MGEWRKGEKRRFEGRREGRKAGRRKRRKEERKESRKAGRKEERKESRKAGKKEERKKGRKEEEGKTVGGRIKIGREDRSEKINRERRKGKNHLELDNQCRNKDERNHHQCVRQAVAKPSGRRIRTNA